MARSFEEEAEVSFANGEMVRLYLEEDCGVVSWTEIVALKPHKTNIC